MITLKPAETVEEVDSILRDPELFDRISEDDIEDYVTPFDGHQIYLLIVRGGLVIGVWNLYPANTTTLNIHCNILKEHRTHGHEASLLILNWFVNDCPSQYQKLNAEIPKVYPEVYHHTKKFGFKDEGVNRKSIMKKGKLTDQWRLGVTKKEVKAYLEVSQCRK